MKTIERLDNIIRVIFFIVIMISMIGMVYSVEFGHHGGFFEVLES